MGINLAFKVLQTNCKVLQTNCKVLQTNCKVLQTNCKVLQTNCKVATAASVCVSESVLLPNIQRATGNSCLRPTASMISWFPLVMEQTLSRELKSTLCCFLLIYLSQN